LNVAVLGCVDALPVPFNLGGDDGQKAKEREWDCVTASVVLLDTARYFI
jgi:hypothetical protein